LSDVDCRRLQRALLDWFAEYKRDLPWRRSRDPYSTWVSEIMLQQTQVATVVPYFERWIKRYPTVSVLAKANEDEVLKVWEGLGYYSRARNLIRGARQMVKKHQGKVPKDAALLRQIPGIGRYTAGAIASIAFDLPEPILDGNVIRVLCRIRDLAGDPRKAPLHEHLWSLARRLVTDTTAAHLNESLMELGATVCTRQNPQCSSCPLSRQCLAHKLGRASERPGVAQRPPELQKDVFIVLATRGQSHVLVLKQAKLAVHWADLWTFPYFERVSPSPPASQVRRWISEQLQCTAKTPGAAVTGKYSITRFRFTYIAVQAKIVQLSPSGLPPIYSWKSPQQLGELAMPAPHRKLAQAFFQHDH
jgi:A/G-specific adenine glycosylase